MIGNQPGDRQETTLEGKQTWLIITRTTSGRPSGKTGTVDPKLLEMLVCPVTKTTLIYDSEAQELISKAAKLAYPIREGVPIMLFSEARQLED